MRITGRKLLESVISAAPNSPKAKDLRAWLNIVENRRWAGNSDLLSDFPTAIGQGNCLWLFPLQKSGVMIHSIVGFRGNGQIIIKKVQ